MMREAGWRRTGQSEQDLLEELQIKPEHQEKFLALDRQLSSKGFVLSVSLLTMEDDDCRYNVVCTSGSAPATHPETSGCDSGRTQAWRPQTFPHYFSSVPADEPKFAAP